MGKSNISEYVKTTGFNLVRYHIGFYPDFQSMYYVSSTGELKGKYGKGSRIASLFFGIPTYYDHMISSIPAYSSYVDRTLRYFDENKPPVFTPDITETIPNLNMYYKRL